MSFPVNPVQGLVTHRSLGRRGYVPVAPIIRTWYGIAGSGTGNRPRKGDLGL